MTSPMPVHVKSPLMGQMMSQPLLTLTCPLCVYRASACSVPATEAAITDHALAVHRVTVLRNVRQ